jgi:hypothetical protein
LLSLPRPEERLTENGFSPEHSAPFHWQR